MNQGACMDGLFSFVTPDMHAYDLICAHVTIYSLADQILWFESITKPQTCSLTSYTLMQHLEWEMRYQQYIGTNHAI